MHYVYKITFPNGKIYIGKTSKTPYERVYENWKTYRKGYPVQLALRKYGLDAVQVETLLETESHDAAIEQEKLEITAHKSRDRHFGYNVAHGGDGGDNFSALSRERQEALRLGASKRAKRIFSTPEMRAKLGSPGPKNPMFGKTHTEEVKKKLAEYRRMQPLTSEQRQQQGRSLSKTMRERSRFSLEEWKIMRANILAEKLSATKAMLKYKGLTHTIAKHLKNGKHWSCQETL